MKICWDNLEKLKYSKKTGKWYGKGTVFIYKEKCPECEEPYLGRYYLRKNQIIDYCSRKCADKNNRGNLGKKFSEEHRKKIGESNKGRIQSDKTKRKIGKANTGKKRSKDVREKISERNTGKNNPFYNKKHTIKTRMIISKANKNKTISSEHKQKLSTKYQGKNNPNWKGGIACEPYCDVWLDKDFKQTIRDRDNNTCQNCGVTRMLSLKIFSENLSIHHIDYNKKNCHPENLITLCNSCNSKANGNREFHKIFYEEIMRRII